MSQLIVRKLDEGIKERLKVRAKRSGRTLKAEVRAILEAAAADAVLFPRSKETGPRGFDEPAPTEFDHGRGLEADTRSRAERKQRRPRKTRKGLGTLMHERFKEVGLTKEERKQFDEAIRKLWGGD
jgi:hypothetical protein